MHEARKFKHELTALTASIRRHKNSNKTDNLSSRVVLISALVEDGTDAE